MLPAHPGAMPHSMNANLEAFFERSLLVDDLGVGQALAMLSNFVTGPPVPPLPPGGCYGQLYISSAVSDGLGSEAAEAAKAAAEGLGERPVKVLLPWYPNQPGIAMSDQTQPAKLPVVEERAHEKQVLLEPRPQPLIQQLQRLQQLRHLQHLPPRHPAPAQFMGAAPGLMPQLPPPLLPPGIALMAQAR